MARAMDDLLTGTKLHDPKALGRGQRTRITTPHGELEVRAFEVKHWGARWRYDKFRGYNGYVLAREGKQLIFGGDTAWIESFRGLRRHGPFEMAIMPIGAYRCGKLSSHCTPEEAAAMANDAGARYLLPIHHQTFHFGQEHLSEPIARLRSAWRTTPSSARCCITCY